MRPFRPRHLVTALLALSFSASASAADLSVDQTGHLTGATGVNVNGTSYYVAFVDGTCSSVFGSCNSANFAFTNADDARAAVTALLNQVFIDGSAGQFDSNPALTAGCSYDVLCITFVPYSTFVGYSGIGATPEVSVGTTANWNSEQYDTPDVSSGYLEQSYDTTLRSSNTWAVFSLSPLPEPSSWAMMLLGFGLMGLGLRRNRRRNTATV